MLAATMNFTGTVLLVLGLGAVMIMWGMIRDHRTRKRSMDRLDRMDRSSTRRTLNSRH